jgi:hypothetical protein
LFSCENERKLHFKLTVHTTTYKKTLFVVQAWFSDLFVQVGWGAVHFQNFKKILHRPTSQGQAGLPASQCQPASASQPRASKLAKA